MTIFSEIAFEITQNTNFWDDYEKMIAESVLTDISQSINGKTEPHADYLALSRLLQAAFIFSNCEDEHHKELAQRISTSTLKVLDQNDTQINNIFRLIQGKLLNYPAISQLKLDINDWSNLPLFLRYDYIKNKTYQTIHTTDGREYVFTPFQLSIWDHLINNKSISLSGPTSSGKSYVLLNFISEQFKSNNIKVAVYLVPTRALINQVSDDAVEAFSKLNLHNITVSTVPVDLELDESSKILYVFTQERLEFLLISSEKFSIDTLVIDESQTLSNGSRGVLLESVIDRIIGLPNTPQIIFSGPSISNPEYFGMIFNIDNFLPISTATSPVTQNIILLSSSYQPTSKVDIAIYNDKIVKIATLPLPIRLLTDIDKLSYLSAYFGRSGSSIVYANGKADAEKVALKIAQELPSIEPFPDELLSLIKFVKRHIHKDYALVETLKKGVAFHYGHMPSLLRKTLEDFFRDRKIIFLVTTSTLLYGINLPTKNIFLLKPTTGRGSAISGPDFWNLAGRAGRLGKELEGNVYLIDYNSWENVPLEEKKSLLVTSSIKKAVLDNHKELIEYIENDGLASEYEPEIETTVGKLLLDYRHGNIDRTLSRYISDENYRILSEIKSKISETSQAIELPSSILNKNIRVSPFRQRDLLNYFIKRLTELPPEEIIPIHPLSDFKLAQSSYRRAFKRIHTYLLKYKSGDKRHNYFSGIALRWMRGDPLPVLINSSIKHHQNQKSSKSKPSIIRDTMETIEEDLRFRYVKFFTCYNSLLSYALEKLHLNEYISSIPDIPLFLEMGGSSGVMINLMALGLSRTSAESLSDYITDKDASIEQLRQWIVLANIDSYDLSSICIREIQTVVNKIANSG